MDKEQAEEVLKYVAETLTTEALALRLEMMGGDIRAFDPIARSTMLKEAAGRLRDYSDHARTCK